MSGVTLFYKRKLKQTFLKYESCFQISGQKNWSEERWLPIVYWVIRTKKMCETKLGNNCSQILIQIRWKIAASASSKRFFTCNNA